ncbi:sporulation thiol-disulfide oxidoreductase A precursor [mine drainage metagenome]|uniref:Sporulation thiol-disulfide oxidoreductase A n=1 Tax=mine drainage metagenome TaxID=410659 RepID=A0A1J5TPI7_9ZZZZ
MTIETGSKPRKTTWRNLAINILLFAVVVVGIRTWQQRDMISGAAPALRGATLTGQPYILPAHPAQPVLVHFWGTWCPICRAEQGSIAAIAHDHPNIITVAMQSGKPEEVARYMREQGIDFPVVNDADGGISNAWGVHAVPASFIIAPDGKIRFVEVGYTSGPGLRFRLWLAGII